MIVVVGSLPADEPLDATSIEIAHALERLSMAIERFDKQFEETDRQETQKKDWQRVAFVCDRFLLYVFVVVTAVASCMILFSSPHGPLRRPPPPPAAPST